MCMEEPVGYAIIDRDGYFVLYKEADNGRYELKLTAIPVEIMDKETAAARLEQIMADKEAHNGQLCFPVRVTPLYAVHKRTML